MPEPSSIIDELRRTPLANAASLMRALEIRSQATFSRQITRAGKGIVAIGRARARRYAAARSIAGVGAESPLFRVDATGKLAQIATVRPIAPQGYFVDAPIRLSRWMRGHRADQVFDGLPVFLADMRPQGFLGRTFARRNAPLGLADNPDLWSEDDIFVALARAGEDAIGDLILGEESARRLYEDWASDAKIVALAERATAYPELADKAIDGMPPGSSAGGEQPKFGVIVGSESSPAHLLVKFSPSDDSEVAQRWRDLLLCEHIALQTLRHYEFSTVTSEVLAAGGRVYLQTGRFDRVGLRGRRPVVTLFALNGEYVGMPPSTGHWTDAMRRLQDDRWVLPETTERVRQLQTFGEFIANSDMHFGNLSLIPDGDDSLALAPVYDMLPMSYAPVGGEVPERDFSVPVPQPGFETIWRESGARGIEFWRAVASDERVSPSFRAVAGNNADAIVAALARFA